MFSTNNVYVSPRTLCLLDERNVRKNCEVKTWRLVSEQPLTSIFPCVDSIHFILSALISAHDSPPESTYHPSLANVSDGKLSLHASLCLDVVTCVIVLLVHDGACALLAFRRGKKVKTHTKQVSLALLYASKALSACCKHMLPLASCHLCPLVALSVPTVRSSGTVRLRGRIDVFWCSSVGADRPPKEAIPVTIACLEQENLGFGALCWERKVIRAEKIITGGRVPLPARSGYISENRVQFWRKVDVAGYTPPFFVHGRVKVGADQSAVSVSRCK